MKYMVLYTDGSARPNPGRTGYGVHGYIGDEGSFKTIDSKWVMTTQGYRNKKDKSKYTGLKPDYIIEKYGRNEDSSTNNQAELDALIEALIIGIERLKEEDALHIIADSEYVVRYVNNILNGKNADYNSNVPYLEKIKELMGKIKFTMSIERVDGHAGVLGNEEADSLSNIGRNLKNNDLESRHVFKEIIVDPTEYWFYEPVINDFLKKNKKLLISLKNEPILNNSNLHCVTNYKRKSVDEIGKKDPSINYTIIENEKPVEEIELIYNYVRAEKDDMLKPYVINLSEVLNKRIAVKLHLYKEDYLIKRKIMFEVVETTDSTPIILATEIFPQSLSWYTVEHFRELYKFKNEYDNKNSKVKTLDIKDLILENIKEKKVTIETDTFKTNLVFRINIPEPSLFSNLKKKLDKVELLYKENDEVIYDTCIFISTIDGQWMIETNAFGKIRFKKKSK